VCERKHPWVGVLLRSSVMRKVILSCVVAVIVAGCSDIPIDGLSRSGWSGPASMPPSGYTKSTWVDSRGCVFFATGQGWVPHVGGGLKQVCH